MARLFLEAISGDYKFELHQELWAIPSLACDFFKLLYRGVRASTTIVHIRKF